MSTEERSHPFRAWLVPLLLLFGAALVLFVVTLGIDAHRAGEPGRVWRLVFDPNPESAIATLSNAGEIVAAVLAIAITVVAIVVELAANRYTHRITELFVGTPINFLVMGFFVITALQSLWVTLIFDYDPAQAVGFVPRLGIVVSMVMLALCLLILLPYFGFVFAFLNPIQIVKHIETHTLQAIRARRTSPSRKKQEAIRGIEQIADVGLNAMDNKDKGVSMASVDALHSLIVAYQDIRSQLSADWFVVEGELAHNPDFVSMSDDVLADVSGRRIWFEMKVFRQYQTIYNEALNRMRDVNYVIAIHTRRVAEQANEKGNHELLDLTLKFFNTYVRATINASDVRTAYNALHQYRLLAEGLLDVDRGRRAIEIARYFRYYGLTAYGRALPFILETVAYDLCSLCELAFDRQSEALRPLLRIFLDVDKESESEVQEASLRGVRKAQVKLATYFLLKGDESLARQVYRDMEREPASRLTSIRDELLAVRSAEFWEISDRGLNFDFLSPDRKAKMMEFFDWFGGLLPPRASRLPDWAGDVVQGGPIPASLPSHDVPGVSTIPPVSGSQPPEAASSEPERPPERTRS